MRVVGVDIGSVRPPSNFAWVAIDAPAGAVRSTGVDPEGAVWALAEAVAEGRKAVLTVEAPMAVPVPEPVGGEWQALGRARDGEGNRPWSAGAGAGALATGVAQTAWMLSRLRTLAPDVRVTTQVPRFVAGEAGLLLSEAFVSSVGKRAVAGVTQHLADAEAAARAVLSHVVDGPGDSPGIRCAPKLSLNLLALLADWAGLEVARDERHLEVLVVRTSSA